ncbi:hypothetical protein OROMI_015787 [Orobanche minor]
MTNNVVAAAPDENDVVWKVDDGKSGYFSILQGFVSEIMGCNRNDGRRIIHSIKVGIALVTVSLLYMVNPMFNKVGENGMWAIMTVVVMFEFYAGATLGKGINRIIGTLLGGVLGCLVATLGGEVGGIGKPIIVAASVFVSGVAATNCRMVPKLKKSHDYGFMIFILTFSLVAISGVRAEKIVEVGRDRLATIGMGFAVCIFISLVICPIWASNELHYSTTSKFDKLATSIQDAWMNISKWLVRRKSNGLMAVFIYKLAPQFSTRNPMMNYWLVDYTVAKSIDHGSDRNRELVLDAANHAKWEPWHGKFGVYYPWEKYLEVGGHLRELATTIFSLKGCLQSPKQPSPIQRQTLKEPCESFMQTIQWILKELGESIEKMELCKTNNLINPRLQSVKLQLTPPQFSSCKTEVLGTDENLAITTFNFLLVEIVEKCEILSKKVEELGEAANFRVRKIDA